MAASYFVRVMTMCFVVSTCSMVSNAFTAWAMRSEFYVYMGWADGSNGLTEIPGSIFQYPLLGMPAVAISYWRTIWAVTSIASLLAFCLLVWDWAEGLLQSIPRCVTIEHEYRPRTDPLPVLSLFRELHNRPRSRTPSLRRMTPACLRNISL